jgi:hypothetical protein
MTAILCSVLLALAPHARGDASQRGSSDATAGGEDRSGAPGAGIESGHGNGMEGGRTDEGPLGGTGIRFSGNPEAEAARANAYDQLRGPNKPGSFLRPADTAPQMNLDPKPIGSGAPQMPVDEHF